MQCLWLIIALISVVLLISIFYNLNQLRKETKKIMGTQERFNEQLDALQASADSIAEAVASEGQQIRDFIAANPSVDTSALDGVIGRLDNIGASVGAIFEPVVDPEPSSEPEAEPTGEEPSGGEQEPI